jgi:hypothetical protein
MNWNDTHGKKLSGVAQAEAITAALNNGLISQDINNRYYIKSNETEEIHISTVPSTIYNISQLRKYIPPKKIKYDIISLLDNLKENIDVLQNYSYPDATSFNDDKAFKLNNCYSNSGQIFHLVQHLSNIKAIRLKKPVQIVFGYICNKIPFGTQIGDAVIENHNIWLHDWHVWNYIEDVLVDMSMFNNGGLLNPNGNVTSWGSSQDHVFIYPPNKMQYWGVAFTDYNRFNEIFADILGITKNICSDNI